MKNYEIRDDMGTTETIQAKDLDEAREQAEQWCREGDWPDDRTVWVDVRIREEESEEWDDRITVTIDPPEPECLADEHDWQSPIEIVGGIKENPGVWGSGGGVKIQAVCMRCGCGRLTDTWAHRPDTGEQGLTSVSYEPEQYLDEVREHRIQKIVDDLPYVGDKDAREAQRKYVDSIMDDEFDLDEDELEALKQISDAEALIEGWDSGANPTELLESLQANQDAAE